QREAQQPVTQQERNAANRLRTGGELLRPTDSVRVFTSAVHSPVRQPTASSCRLLAEQAAAFRRRSCPHDQSRRLIKPRSPSGYGAA
ncbi:MAG: hypothetical protein WCQ77_15270, partial [Planctomycetota bacterium]